MMSCAGIAVTSGAFIVYLMGCLMDWRSASLLCAIVPLTALISICFVRPKFEHKKNLQTKIL